MEKIIKAAVERGASDLLIKAGDVFRARINGKLVPLTKQRLTPDQTRAIALKLITGEDEKARIDKLKDFDCSWGMPGVGRFRVNVLRQRSSFMVVMRVIPFDVPTFETLGLPDAVQQVAEAERGLVIVTGLTGSGKTSTIAAMINHINRNHHKHVVTIESPIEYLHRDINCSVTQREVGVDTESYSVGLGAALRQDPDVVVIGEMRDPETLDLALKGAEMGHLVIAALPSPDVISALTRLFSMFPRDERQVGRLRLADTIRAVVAQQLLAKKDGEGRIAAMEVLTSSAELRSVLKKSDGFDLIRNLISDAQEPGTQSLEDHLMQLVDEGQITEETARAAVSDPDSLQFAGGKGKKKAKK